MMILIGKINRKNWPISRGLSKGFRPLRVIGIAASVLSIMQPGIFAAPVAARVASVKGKAIASSVDLSSEALRAGMIIRSGTVITTGAESGVLIRPAPKVSLVVYMSTKVRFDGANIDARGQGSVQCSVLGGQIRVIIDTDSQQLATGPGKVKISIATQEGAIVGSKGTWTVQQEDGRTMVAVSEGAADVSIGGGAAAGSGSVGSQVEVPEGSVMWLQRRDDGLVEAKIVNTETGAMVVILPDGTRDTSQKAPADLLSDARSILDGSGDSTTVNPSVPSTDGNGTPTTPNNPDFSTPKPEKPVVSQDTP